jgi:hypothetical protein
VISLLLLTISFVLYRKGREIHAAVAETLGLRIGAVALVLALILWVARIVCHAVASGDAAILAWCNNLVNSYPAECMSAVRSAVVWQDLADNLDYALLTMLIL